MTKLLAFDAFTKPVEDARIRTKSGAIITISALFVTWLLLLIEWRNYRSVVIRPTLTVDKFREESMDIDLDITFHHMPCDLMTLDLMDIAGDLQEDVTHGIKKIRLDSQGKEIGEEDLVFSSEKDDSEHSEHSEDVHSTSEEDPDCGPCYGAKPEGECCNTCADVRNAYAERGWAFYDGSGIKQCEREHYQEKLAAMANEGCRIVGFATVNKIAGNFHFAPGKSHTEQYSGHVHDLSLYTNDKSTFTFSHSISRLAFGRGTVHKNTLDGAVHQTDSKLLTFSYYLKVVSVTDMALDGTVKAYNDYTATSHERPLGGGRDEDHPHTLHRRGGLPGVFFHYDISSLKINNVEQRRKTFGEFMMSVGAIIGGVLSVAAILDRGVWEADKALRRKKGI